MKFINLFLLVALIIFGVASCTKASENDDYDYDFAAASINHFTFSILPLLDGSNVFFSPYSISSALAMTYAGARGNTEKEMNRALHFPVESNIIHPSFRNLNQELENRKREGIVLNNANALWIDETARLQKNFLVLTQRYYKAGAEKLDFINQPEESRVRINNWIEEKTEDKIQDLLVPGDVTPDTRLILTNAIYFLGAWKDEFSPELTKQELFYPADGSRLLVPFMKREAAYNYYATQEFQVLEIPYTGEELSMVIILPTSEVSLSSLIEMMDYAQYENAINSMEIREVNVQIPKFKFESKFNLKDYFIKLGMIDAFSGDADFTGMTGGREQFLIDEIIHQAYIEVEEKGTEAAAATAVIMRTTSVQETPRIINFKADRPFLFFIRDNITETILFTGTLSQPEGVRADTRMGQPRTRN